MKALIVIISLTFVALIGCKSNSQSNSLEGTFTNQSKSEYSTASDTLIITRSSQSSNTYQIERRTGFQKIRNGVTQAKEYKTEKWQSSWSDDKQVLSETEYGRQITPGKDGNSVKLKNTEYQKIK
ncbi:hypothetical protein [Mucilaginibacter gossypii]|uniref:Lipoprotein n=1 Tax=Mucilaginibacter gossypii TaxID=551996 RepID=A0A1G7RJQ4_9SPHI|nr:hypothetical protein [Mucilaginibacter gossypii]SDG10904.1 hypothetical protein SAMN05192573_102262 [Mucilaginibacter gossypii]